MANITFEPFHAKVPKSDVSMCREMQNFVLFDYFLGKKEPNLQNNLQMNKM
jgi:hypothetical protein